VVSGRLQGKPAVKGEISIEYLQMQAKLPGKSRRLMRSLTRLIINIYLIKENGQNGDKKKNKQLKSTFTQGHKTRGLTEKLRFDLKTALRLSLYSSRPCLPLPNKAVSPRKAIVKNCLVVRESDLVIFKHYLKHFSPILFEIHL